MTTREIVGSAVRSKLGRAALFALLAAVVTTACRQRTSNQETCTYRVGAVLPLTGELSDFGKTTSAGLTLAFPKGQKTKSGCLIELVVADGRGDVNASVTAYNRLRGDGADVIVTNVSGVSLALAERARRENVILFADAAHPQLTPRRMPAGEVPMVFRHSSVATQEATLFLRALEGIARKGVPSRVAVSVLNNDYGVAVLEALKEALKARPGLAVLVDESRFDPTDTEFMAVAFDIRRVKPDVAVLVGYSRSLGLLLNFLREGAFTGRILCSVGFLVTQDAVNVAGANAEGVVYNGFKIEPTSTPYLDFSARYMAEFRSPPSQVAVLMHNTGLLIRHVIEGSTDLSPGGLGREFLALKTFVGAGETMTIEPNGDVLPELGLAEYHESGSVWLSF